LEKTLGQINLYQYTVSPFTEKVRRVLTYKNLKWNPIECHYEDKTNLLKVTDGKWTRVPVLEWDGQVVFNSVDIIKWLDQKVAQPTVFPDNSRGLCEIVDHWADNTLFMPILTLTIPDLLDNAGDAQLKANREKLIGMSTAQMRERHGPARDQLALFCKLIDTQLAGKDFFLGNGKFSLADASLYHPFFFLTLSPGNFQMISEYPNLKKWHERIRDLS
jgi:glutathione S-transferase